MSAANALAPTACFPDISYLPWNWCLPVWAGLMSKEPVNSNGTFSLGPKDVNAVLIERASNVSATFISILSPAALLVASKSIKVEAELKPLIFFRGKPSSDLRLTSISFNSSTSVLLSGDPPIKIVFASNWPVEADIVVVKILPNEPVSGTVKFPVVTLVEALIIEALIIVVLISSSTCCNESIRSWNCSCVGLSPVSKNSFNIVFIFTAMS